MISKQPSRNRKPDAGPILASAVTALFIALTVGACNPFAPGIAEGDPFGLEFGDQKTIPGFFANFKLAYELRDMSLYESLLDSGFVFVYRDFETQIDRQWGFAQDLEGTRRLFQSTNFVQLQWNQEITRDVDDDLKRARIIRSFTLTVGVEGSDALRSDGNVNFLVTRRDTNAVWKLLRWRDESEL